VEASDSGGSRGWHSTPGRDCEDDHGHVDTADGIPRREGDKEPRWNLCYFDTGEFVLNDLMEGRKHIQ